MRDFRNYAADQGFVGLIDQILHALLLQPHRLRARSLSNSSAGTTHSHADSRDGTGLGVTSLASPSAPSSLPTAGPVRRSTEPGRAALASWVPDASVSSPSPLPQVAAGQPRGVPAGRAAVPPSLQTRRAAEPLPMRQAQARPRDVDRLTASLVPGRLSMCRERLRKALRTGPCAVLCSYARALCRGPKHARHAGAAASKP